MYFKQENTVKSFLLVGRSFTSYLASTIGSELLVVSVGILWQMTKVFSADLLYWAGAPIYPSAVTDVGLLQSVSCVL